MPCYAGNEMFNTLWYNGGKNMSKVLLINGSPHENGCTFTALTEIADTFAKNGVESDMAYLGKQPVAG